MRQSRRQVVIHILERLGLALILLDVALYFAAFRPVENLRAGEQGRSEATRRRIREEEERVERLEKFQEALPSAGERIDVFKRDHVPSRRRGFSQAAHLIRQVTDEAGVQLASVGYRLDLAHGDPLERLGLDINVGGSFPGLFKFAHGLETASDFVLIREFNLEPKEGSTLGLHLKADLYLTP